MPAAREIYESHPEDYDKLVRREDREGNLLEGIRGSTSRTTAITIRGLRTLLDRSATRGETYCLADDPAVGYGVWPEVDIRPLITPAEAMRRLMAR